MNAEEKLKECQDYLRKLMWRYDGGVMGSGMTLCRECGCLKDEEKHKPDCKLASLLEEPTKPTMTDELRTIAALIDEAENIFRKNSLCWEAKYDIIFAMKIWQKIRDAGLHSLEWYDPDAGYEDDVTAYMNALRQWRRDYISF